IAGLLHVQLALALGAKRVIATDIVDYRLDAARRFGAEAVIRAEEYTQERLRQVNDGRLADVVIVCTGSESAQIQALESVERGGTVLLFAPTNPDFTIPIPVNDLFFRNDITLTTSYAGSPADYAEALELIRSGRVNVHDMITHRFGLSETGEGFLLVAEARESIKVIVEPQR
ncbi:MAG: zinc-binding dehydrogenase, partial [Dehalococcoidia bacterium]|nr:zinc-binding dehydrogenase [Dehalococcoidia bacterium]